MKQSWLQRRWPAIRAQGLLRFVLLRGVLMWGGLMTLAVYAMLLLTARRQGLQLDAAWPLVPLFCIPAGVFWSLLGWYWNDYLFRKLGFDKSDPHQ
jgi:hypothetical protein